MKTYNHLLWLRLWKKGGIDGRRLTSVFVLLEDNKWRQWQSWNLRCWWMWCLCSVFFAGCYQTVSATTACPQLLGQRVVSSDRHRTKGEPKPLPFSPLTDEVPILQDNCFHLFFWCCIFYFMPLSHYVLVKSVVMPDNCIWLLVLRDCTSSCPSLFEFPCHSHHKYRT